MCAGSIAHNPLQAELETRLQLSETAEERHLRERHRVEEADNDLTEDLFSGAGHGKGSEGGISAIPLKSMQVRSYPFMDYVFRNRTNLVLGALV